MLTITPPMWFHKKGGGGVYWFAYDKIMDTENQTSWSLKKILCKWWYKRDKVLGLKILH